MRIANTQVHIENTFDNYNKKLEKLTEEFTERSEAEIVKIQKRTKQEMSELMDHISKSDFHPKSVTRLLQAIEEFDVSIDKVINLIARYKDQG
ncbi:hypothetical protein [Tateyamaria sp. SN6-1]|uniref:hypothetical protein n=1 Tax=Tateyamaria sp. SN6-1 TaxID=3092148 RepID=UPI0039F5BC56